MATLLRAITCLNDHEGGRGAWRIDREALMRRALLVIFVAMAHSR